MVSVPRDLRLDFMKMVVTSVTHGVIVGVVLLVVSLVVSVSPVWWFFGVVMALLFGGLQYATDVSVLQKHYLQDREKAHKMCDGIKWFEAVLLENLDGSEYPITLLNFCSIGFRGNHATLELASGALDFSVPVCKLRSIRPKYSKGGE